MEVEGVPSAEAGAIALLLTLSLRLVRLLRLPPRRVRSEIDGGVLARLSCCC